MNVIHKCNLLNRVLKLNSPNRFFSMRITLITDGLPVDCQFIKYSEEIIESGQDIGAFVILRILHNLCFSESIYINADFFTSVEQ